MRKLKLQVQMSLDGFIGGPNGELDWMVWDWDEKLKQFVQDLTDPVGTILLGRKMADGFIKHWAAVAANPQDPTYEAGKKFTDTPRVVFTKTLKKSEWDNATLATGDLAEEVNKLKNQEGGDMIVYGGAGFVSSLIKAELIDELNFFVNPTILGKGLSIFKEVESRQNLHLVKATQYDCGIVVLTYKRAG